MKRIGLIVVLLTGAIFGALTAVSQSRGRPGSGGVSYDVRALFDNAEFAVSGEEVRVAGAQIGTIGSVSVTHDDLAAVTLDISNRSVTPFHAGATCRIRPQSLIGEEYVDCTPGPSTAPPLRRITRGAGSGEYLLPVTQTSSSIDPDIVQDISQEPLRERLSIILDELGTGLAARGADLNAVILRANPALEQTDRVFRILAGQDRVLADLARDSNTVLAPLARARRQLAGFITGANTTALASAQRQAAISASIRLLPGFLSRLKPLLADLGQLAGQGTPLMRSLGASAAGVDRQFAELVPFAGQARKALLELGSSARQSQASLVASEPLADRLLALGHATKPSATLLARLLGSLDETGGIEDLMHLLFYGTGATNGFDADGHYARTDALVGSCTPYARRTVVGCSANFSGVSKSDGVRSTTARDGETSRGDGAAAPSTARLPKSAAQLRGLLGYLIGGSG